MSSLHLAVRALLGGLGSALAVAGPLVDNGLKASEGIAIALAFLTGSGLTSLPNGSTATAPVDEPVEGDPNA